MTLRWIYIYIVLSLIVLSVCQNSTDSDTTIADETTTQDTTTTTTSTTTDTTTVEQPADDTTTENTTTSTTTTASTTIEPPVDDIVTENTTTSTTTTARTTIEPPVDDIVTENTTTSTTTTASTTIEPPVDDIVTENTTTSTTTTASTTIEPPVDDIVTENTTPSTTTTSTTTPSTTTTSTTTPSTTTTSTTTPSTTTTSTTTSTTTPSTTTTAASVCDVPSTYREDCGYWGISQDGCELSYDCCYNSSLANPCYQKARTVNGSWGEWGTWTSCSAGCGTGNRYRTRTCDNPAPFLNGYDCEGNSEDAGTCTAGECCAPKVFDMVYLFDPTEYSTSISNLKTLYKNITGIFTVSPSATRISIVTITSPPKIRLKFNEFSDVSAAIDSISRSYSTSDPKAALEFVRSDVLTEQNGARADIADAIVMNVRKSSYYYDSWFSLIDDDPKPAAQKLKDKGALLMIAEGRSQTEFRDLADVYESYSSYFYQSDLAAFSTKIAQGFPCNYFCSSSVFALDTPANLGSGNDSSSGYLYLMTDTPYQMTCCGATSTWEFYAVNTGIVEVMIFRNTARNQYYLVGSTRIVIPVEYVGTTVSFNLIAGERVALVEGDLIGWYTSGPNVVGHADCSTNSGASDYRADCPQGNKMLQISRDTFSDEDTIDFSSATSVPNRGYSIKLATTNNTELTIVAVQNETELEENTPIGFKAMYFRVTDSDLGDNFTMTLSGDSALFAISDVKYEQVELTLKQKLPVGGGGPYIITITGQDSCQHSASTTVTVSTYNAPPIINNLPQIMEISETVKEAMFLYTINVTDATEDPICCTMSKTLPNTYNFQLKFENGLYSIWTSNNPAFSYGDNDAYRIYICCNDPYGSSNSYLVLRLIETKEDSTYIPPDWFTRAIAVSMLPISIMTLLTFATLILTMFFLDPPNPTPGSAEEDLAEPAVIVSRNDILSPESEIGTDIEDSTKSATIDETEIKTKPKGETIYFKNTFTDEEFHIPVWRARKNNQVTDQPTNDAKSRWQQTTAKVINEDITEFDSRLPQGNEPFKRSEFGVDMKLFHYGRTAPLEKTERERSFEILKKKSDIKGKWQDMIAQAALLKKQKELKLKQKRQMELEAKNQISELENEDSATKDNLSTLDAELENYSITGDINNETETNDIQEETETNDAQEDKKETQENNDTTPSVLDLHVEAGVSPISTLFSE